MSISNNINIPVFSNRGNQIDWSEIVSGVNKSVNDIDKNIKNRRIYDEELLKKSERKLEETELTQSQTLNEFLLRGIDNGKNNIYEWNKQLKSGDINRAEYKRRLLNIQDSWDDLNIVTKTMDERIQNSINRQQVGENGELPLASGVEVEMQGYFGALANLKNRELFIGDDGKTMIKSKDKNGNISYENVKYINNPLNITFNRVDVAGVVGAGIDEWGDWDIGRTSDTRQNPQYKQSKQQLIDLITSSPRSASSVLVDYSKDNYTVYFNEDDKAEKKEQLKTLLQNSSTPITDSELELRLIKMKQDENGNYQPELTSEQNQKAKDVVGREIEMQVGRKVESAPMYYGGGGYRRSSSKSSGMTDEELMAGYTSSLRAFGYNPQSVASNITDSGYWGFDDSKIDFSGLNKSYKYVYENGKVMVYDSKSSVLGDNATGQGNLLYIASNPKELSQFLYRGNDSSMNPTYWEQARSKYLSTQNRGRIESDKNKPRTNTSVKKQSKSEKIKELLGGD